MKTLALASLVTVAFMTVASHTFPVQPSHLSINGHTLCGSPIGNHVDVLAASRDGHYCAKCAEVIADSDATE